MRSIKSCATGVSIRFLTVMRPIGIGVLGSATGSALSGTLPPGSLSDLGLDLSGHHPVSFPYQAALPNDELASSPPPDLVYGGNDEVHCITCHDPHKDQFGKFLLKDNRYSALCVTCHVMSGWSGSAHATSTASVSGILPRPPKTWRGRFCGAPGSTWSEAYSPSASTCPPTKPRSVVRSIGPRCVTGGCSHWSS